MKSLLVKFIFSCCFALGIVTLFSSSKKHTTLSNNSLSQLGRYLFFDTRLSFNNIRSCGSCHDPKFAFSDGYRTSLGAEGFSVQRNAPSLINAVYRKSFTWADSSVKSFKEQMQFPLFNEHPIEMGVKNNETTILNRFKNNKEYNFLFKAAFPNQQQPINISNIITAIAAYESTIISNNSPYNKFLKGNLTAMNTNAKEGMKLFFSDKLNCGKCHNGAYLAESPSNNFYNTGLYNINQSNTYPTEDKGLYNVTKLANDDGKFRVPSLLNVLLTAPYTHDGTVNTIDEMIAIYANGGRNITEGKRKGDGSKNELKSKLITGFSITNTEKKQLIAFLATLTDSSIFNNKNFKNPFQL